MLAAAVLLPLKTEAVSAKRAYVLDAVSGRVLYEKNPDERSLIASTTKIMTALLICEQCNVLDRVCIPKEAVGIEGSSMYLREGEILTVQDLLYGLMLRSGNDAAVAIAEHISGSVDAFAEKMNTRAEELDANARFANPHGLDAEGHRASALGLARIMREAMEHEAFRTISSTQKKNTKKMK